MKRVGWMLVSLALLLGACGPEPSVTPPPTTVPTLGTLAGIVFFDRNGDGVQGDDEPGVPGVTVQTGDRIATTAADGAYALSGVAPGEGQVRLSAPGFRYVSLSTQDVQATKDPVDVTVDGAMQRSFGLTQGFLTLPFRCCPPFTAQTPLGMSVLFDVDRRVGYVRSYDAQRVQADRKPGREVAGPIVWDQHGGIDYCFPVGTPVVAAAPGVVKHVEIDDSAGSYVILWHPCAGIQTIYAHLSQASVVVGQEVARGQVIARSGESGVVGQPHLHFGCYEGEGYTVPRDPYRDLRTSTSQSLWTVDNAPQYPITQTGTAIPRPARGTMAASKNNIVLSPLFSRRKPKLIMDTAYVRDTTTRRPILAVKSSATSVERRASRERFCSPLHEPPRNTRRPSVSGSSRPSSGR